MKLTQASPVSQCDGLYSIGASIVIKAPSVVIYEILANPKRHSEFDGSGTVEASISTPARLYLNARFSMKMRFGIPYRMTNEVVEFEEGRLIAWRHMGRHIWRYKLRTIDDESTEVTEVFDWKNARSRLAYELLSIPKRNGKSIRDSLVRLKSLAESEVGSKNTDHS